MRPIIRKIYNKQTGKGWNTPYRRNHDVKMLILQVWYGLSDPELITSK
ncbi:MAG: hypothetical protein LBB45_06275 [Methanobrevibacter sp.]|nr:hypothetical protein [Candidatus Methanovirga basalitermitum]